MEVRIQSIHFDASEKLEAFIQKKAEKLEKFCDNIKKVEVSLKVVKPETAMNKEAGVRVLALNTEFYAEKVSDTFEESIDVCMDALSKQLLKAKEKQQGKDILTGKAIIFGKELKMQPRESLVIEL